MSSPSLAAPGLCPECGTEVAASLQSCPGCHRLVHAQELSRLAAEAEERAASGDRTGALSSWRRALELLPAGSSQAQQVAGRVDALSRELEAKGAPGPPAGSRWARWLGPLGPVGLLIWKFKFALGLLLGKGKLLLLGLTKASTLLSMLLSFGVYWTAWGWRFALGLIGSLYIHEMGHVAALQRLGIRATAPMFVPGFGAYVRLSQYPASPREDARVGLAGPLWGLGAALAAYAVFWASGSPLWGAIARTGAWINLFNLVPVWQLDGSRGFRALGRSARALVTVVALVLAVSLKEGLLFLLGGMALLRTVHPEGAPPTDRTAFSEFLLLLVVLSALATVNPTAVP